MSKVVSARWVPRATSGSGCGGCGGAGYRASGGRRQASMQQCQGADAGKKGADAAVAGAGALGGGDRREGEVTD